MQTKTIKILCLSLTLIFLGTAISIAQTAEGGGGFSLTNEPTYKTALGLRLIFDGPTPSLGVKHFFSENNAIEAAILFPEDAFAIEGLYEYQQGFADAKGLYWYGGAGLLALFPNEDVRGETSAFFGLPLIVGLEYKITGAPLVIGLDWQPLIWLSDVEDRFDANQIGLTVRLAFQ